MNVQKKWFHLFFSSGKVSNNFIIFTQGRTGGTLLEDLLNCHSDLYCDGELLNSKKYGDIKLQPLTYIKTKSQDYLNKSYGFRLKIYQLLRLSGQGTGKRLFDQLCDSGWKVIYLKRNNIFRHSLSTIRSQETGLWHNTLDSNLEIKRINIDKEWLIGDMKWKIQMKEKESEFLKGKNYISLFYEDDLLKGDVHQSTADLVFDFLDLKREKVSSELIRTSYDDLTKVILNYDEVVSAIYENQFEHFLD